MPTQPAAPETPHLVVPYAHASDPDCLAAAQTRQLPQLERLLTTLAPCPPDTGSDQDWTPPHERALARALGLAPAQGPCPDGLLPWAAWTTPHSDTACAWFTPCHWQAGMDRLTVLPPESLALSATDDTALMDALAPFCVEDGIALSWHSPGRWLAQGPVFDGLRTASLDRVAHRRPDGWLPHSTDTAATRLISRLMNEAQMLFYAHPVSDRRQAQGLPPINGLWVSGAGRWSGNTTPTGACAPEVLSDLQTPALRGDWTAWGQAWTALDTRLQPWADRVQAGQPLRLTLCGERHAQTWGPAPRTAPGWWARWRHARAQRRQVAPTWLSALQTL